MSPYDDPKVVRLPVRKKLGCATETAESFKHYQKHTHEHLSQAVNNLYEETRVDIDTTLEEDDARANTALEEFFGEVRKFINDSEYSYDASRREAIRLFSGQIMLMLDSNWKTRLQKKFGDDKMSESFFR